MYKSAIFKIRVNDWIQQNKRITSDKLSGPVYSQSNAYPNDGRYALNHIHE